MKEALSLDNIRRRPDYRIIRDTNRLAEIQNGPKIVK
jgi:hypothetical protein